LGDILGAEGTLFKTKTGELSVRVTLLRLLTKSLRPLPDKFHGMSDQEQKYRQRYVDLITDEEARTRFAARSKAVSAIRNFMVEHGFLEVETPMLHPIPGGANAKPFKTHHNALDQEMFLRIAPELYLKRLVVGGLERVFELSRVFRNEGLSTRHNPEFTMLEFYQAYATYEDLMVLTEEMISGLAREVTDGTAVEFGGETIDLAPPWPRRTMVELVAEQAGVPAERLLERDAVAALAARHAIAVRPEMTAGHLLGALFEALVEPGLVQPTFVTQFPVELSPLARRNDDDPRFVDRFELIVARQEIANAFSELNDPEDQRARFEEQRRARAAGIRTRIGNHTFRAIDITAYLRNGGTLEKAPMIANHASTCTTQLYNRRSDEVSLDEVERILI